MRKKLTKKYAHHTAFYVDHAHIYIFFKIINARLNYSTWTRATY